MGIQALGCCKDRVRDSSTGPSKPRAETPLDQTMDSVKSSQNRENRFAIRKKKKDLVVNNSFEVKNEEAK